MNLILSIFAMYLIDYKYVKNENCHNQKDCRFRRKGGEICHFVMKSGTRADFNQIHDRMKKLIITPQKDTVTLCLPQEWVGKPLLCILEHPDEKDAFPNDSEYVSEVREDRFLYNAELFRQKRRRPRKKRLRRKRGGKNQYL